MSSTHSKFPSASREDWHALVSSALKGGDPQSLDRLDEDINTYLDDHMVSISAMKASRFKFAFEEALDSWERKLTVVTDVVELI